MRRLYEWTLAWAAHPKAIWALFGISFIESSFFLIPPDVLMIPMIIAKPKRWWWFAFITTVGSVLGGIFGYYIGYAFWETVGQAIVGAYGFEHEIELVQTQYENHAFLSIFTAAFTPIPYKVFTIASGLFQIPLLTLITASLLGRSMRFFLVAALIGIWGERVKELIEKYFEMLTLLLVAIFMAGFLMVKLLL